MFMSTLICLSLVSFDEPIVRFQKTIDNVKLDVIQANMSRPELGVKIILAAGFPDSDETFETMVKKAPGVLAAINGAYFDKNTKKPIGDIWTEGRLVRKGLMGTAFCITNENVMDIQRVVRHKGVDWSRFESVLACGPALVLDGKIDCDWRGEGFRDPHVTGSTTRMGIGYTVTKKLLLVRCNTSVTFEEFASVMLALGCHEAMNLDSGASRGFYFQGNFIEKPGRKLTNGLAIVQRRKELH